MESTIKLRPIRESDLESFRTTINDVCSEKWYVASVDGFTLEKSYAFLKQLTENGFPESVAVDRERIIGWCHIVPKQDKGFTHVGRLGIGVAREYRQKGIGRRLLNYCLPLAVKFGLEKIELEVFSDNIPAIRLYASVGFKVEGLKINARKLEDRYQDMQLMALSLADIHDDVYNMDD